MTQVESFATQADNCPLSVDVERGTLGTRADSNISVKCRLLYLLQIKRVWKYLPSWFRTVAPGRALGRHLHALIRLCANRQQYFGTFFLRNRPELALLCRLLARKPDHAEWKIAVLACSKGAEVYSIMWRLRSASRSIAIRTCAVDISNEILEFAKAGVYSLTSAESDVTQEDTEAKDVLRWNTFKDQNAPIFERVTEEELYSIGDVVDDQVRIKPWVKEGITWIRGDAGDSQLARRIGQQDIVVANRFLCHMVPAYAEQCLRNLSSLVRPGGYLFVSGIDLDVRTRVARDMGWKPVTELMKEIHEGDASLTKGWPLEYWGLEPFDKGRADWKLRYASVFQVGGTSEPDPRATI